MGSSVASSRERTPSPGAFMNRGSRNSRNGTGGGEARPWAFQRSGSPADRPGARRTERQAPSPSATLSPYRRPAASVGSRRTPSPGTRSRERTPSPVQGRNNAENVGGAMPPSRGPLPPVSLRGSRAHLPSVASPAPVGGRSGSRGGGGFDSSGRKPISTRYGNSGSRSGSASASALAGSRRLENSADDDSGDLENTRNASRGLPAARNAGAITPSGPEDQHRPGSLFGLAANLGMGPGSLSIGGCSGTSAGGASLGAAPEQVETCDIDARLQALQSFLKQTKGIST